MNPTVRSGKSKALERKPEEGPRIPWAEPKNMSMWLIEIGEIRSTLTTLQQKSFLR